METCKPKCSLTPWFDEQCIRWDKKSIFGLRHAAFQAGLGIIRKNNFFYDEKGSWLELEGFVIDRECQLYQNQQFRIHRGRKIFCVYGKNSSLIRNRYV